MVGCFGYLIKSLGGFFRPDHRNIAAIILVVTNISEISCVLWMLILGAKEAEPIRREARFRKSAS
jgi:hypothetical protein